MAGRKVSEMQVPEAPYDMSGWIFPVVAGTEAGTFNGQLSGSVVRQQSLRVNTRLFFSGPIDITSGHLYDLIEIESSDPIVLTIGADIAETGDWFEVCRIGEGQVSVIAGDGVFVLSPDNADKVSPRFGTARFRLRSANLWVASGDLTT